MSFFVYSEKDNTLLDSQDFDKLIDDLAMEFINIFEEIGKYVETCIMMLNSLDSFDKKL